MSVRAVATHLLAAVAGAALCGGTFTFLQRRAGGESLEARRLALAQADNQRLRSIVEGAEREKTAAENRRKAEDIEKVVAEIRGLPFKNPVDYNVLSRSEIQDVVSKKLSEVYSEQEFANISAAFSRFGVLPEGYPLRQSYIELLGEQIAAFYDQHAHKLFMFQDASLDNAQNRVILAHELTHALQDQHFGLRKLPLEIKTNDDRAVAASALVEGEATLVMSEYMLKNLSLATLKDTMAATMTQDMKQLQKAPRFLQESLVFPYLRGQEFCAALYARGGYNALTKAYENPPSSTSQILHPEKYMGEPREEPVTVEWKDTSFGDLKPEVDNVMGEFGIRLLLAETVGDQTAQSAADGWRGDRYLSFRNGDALVWKSVWRNEQEAQEFLEAHGAVLEKRYKPTIPQAAPDKFDADAPRALRLRQQGNAVVFVDSPTATEAESLLKQFAR